MHLPWSKNEGDSRPIGGDDLEKLLEQVRDLTKKNNRILENREERDAFIQFAIACGVCAGLANFSYAVADVAFSAHYNWQQGTSFVQACSAKPFDCLTGKVPMPQFNLLASPRDNVTAMLDLIAYAEGADYDVMYTGQRFTDFSKHPEKLLCANAICSDAAGKYQFLSTTWNPLKSRLKLPDFSPASQDKAAIQLMKDNGCYGAAVRGDVRAFADRCWNTWASLKSSTGEKLDSRQHAHSIEHLQAKYNELRGNVGTLTKPLSTLTVTSSMSASRTHPVTGEVRPHNGTDYACNAGDVVKSPIAGTFRQGNSDPQGFGNSWGTVAGGGYEVTVGHTQKLLVSDGANVTAGQPIAECGSEGTGSGPHLHIEIRKDGKLINPEEHLK